MDLYIFHHRWQRLLPNSLLVLSVCFGIEQAYVGRWMYKGLTDPKQLVGRSGSAENVTSSTISSGMVPHKENTRKFHEIQQGQLTALRPFPWSSSTSSLH
jgi:hypothetical protein